MPVSYTHLVGSEHLLLGLLEAESGIAGNILHGRDVYKRQPFHRFWKMLYPTAPENFVSILQSQM